MRFEDLEKPNAALSRIRPDSFGPLFFLPSLTFLLSWTYLLSYERPAPLLNVTKPLVTFKSVDLGTIAPIEYGYRSSP